MAAVNCPACGRALEVEDAHRDWTVRCPHCGDEFVPDEVTRESPPAAGDRGRRRRDDEYDEYEDRGRRRRDDEYDEYEDDEFDRTSARAEARVLVSAPATWLEICGWLSVLAAVGGAALCFVLAGAAANNPQQNQNDEPAAMFVFFGCCAGVLGVPYGMVMAIGARHMRNLSSRGWAMTGAILGVASFTLFGLFGLIQTGFGVWALITLDKPVVRAAFGLPPRR